MSRNLARDWMWSEACEMLLRAERLHRQFVRATVLAWEPPADIVETDRAVMILVALPGVDAAAVDTKIEDGSLVIEGRRSLPAEFRYGDIHRLELPQGLFYRRLALPPGRYGNIRRSMIDGCVLVTLEKRDDGR
jgi:HSP20 family protein